MTAEGSRLERAVADRRWAVAEHDRVVQENGRLEKRMQQRLIDAQVRSSRRDMLRLWQRRAGADLGGLLDEELIAVADQPTIYRLIVQAAVTAGGARCADLQLYDRHAGLLRMVDQHGFTPEFVNFFTALDATQPTHAPRPWSRARP